MKLRFAPTSPFVRKCLATAIEAGLEGRLELIATNPMDPADDLATVNPLGKVPVLVTDEGEALYDSRVICEYLDALSTDAKLFPAEGNARWRALRLMALGDGILDAGVLRRYESLRPAAERSRAWDERQREKITRALDALEGEAEAFEGVDIGLITVASALGYLDFRFGQENWRLARPTLAPWYAEFSKRPSIALTVPKEAA